MQPFHIDMGHDRELGILIAGFEKLGVQFDRNFVHLVLGEKRLFDFLLVLLGGIERCAWERSIPFGPAG